MKQRGNTRTVSRGSSNNLNWLKFVAIVFIPTFVVLQLITDVTVAKSLIISALNAAIAYIGKDQFSD